MDTYERVRKSLSLASSHPGEGGENPQGLTSRKKKCGGAQCQISPTRLHNVSLSREREMGALLLSGGSFSCAKGRDSSSLSETHYPQVQTLTGER